MQYKNFKSFLNLMHHQLDFGVPASWSFHATSHGKGACDGIGGPVKRATSPESEMLLIRYWMSMQ